MKSSYGKEPVVEKVLTPVIDENGHGEWEGIHAEFMEQYPEVLYFIPPVKLTHDQFFQFCQINSEWRIERTAEGVIEIMPPAGGETGARNSKLTSQLDVWSEQDGTGVAFDSSTGYDLPSGGSRSPDASWVLRSRLTALKPEDKIKFLPLCPDLVIELRSASDSLKKLQAKMKEWIATGVRLGWLLDPTSRTVYVYRPGEAMETLNAPLEVSADPILPGFILKLKPIWEPPF